MFCQCSLGYVIFGLCKHKLVWVFCKVPISFLELIKLGVYQGIPRGRWQNERSKHVELSPGRSLLSQSRIDFIFVQILITSHYFCVMYRIT